MFRHPSCNALPQAKFQPIHDFRMRILRGSQNQILAFQNIDQAGVALDQRRSKVDHTSQYIMKAIRRRQPIANLVQQIYM